MYFPLQGQATKRLTGKGGKLNTSQAEPVAANSRAVRGNNHLKRYDLRSSATYGWKPIYPTLYESYVCPLSSGIW